MKFGAVPVAEAAGSILAHAVCLPDGRLRKGIRLTDDQVAQLLAAGLTQVVVARLEAGDVSEDNAADRVEAALMPSGV